MTKLNFIKNIILIALFIPICANSQIKEIDSIPYKIIGDWAWIRSYGGATGHELLTPEIVGINKTYKFCDNDTVYIYENNILTQILGYKINIEESLLLNDAFVILTIYSSFANELDSNMAFPMKYLIEKINDTLSISEDVYDGWGHDFQIKTTNHVIYNKIKTEIKIYPNPVNSILYIEIPDIETYPINYEIITVIGNIQLQGTLNSDLKNTIELDISMLDKGFYILRVYFGDVSISKIFYKNFF